MIDAKKQRFALGLGRDLSTTTYASVASLELLLVFGLWSPSGVTCWEPTGAKGWVAVVRGRRPAYGPFPRHGLFRVCRQPVYLAFAIPWTIYCVLGAQAKERRYLAVFGDEFRVYQRQVGFWGEGE